MNKPNNIDEQAIRATVADFSLFCSYINENKPLLSKRKAQLGKKNLFEINALLHFRKDVAAPNYQQESYPVINLLFNLATQKKLYVKTTGPKGNIFLSATLGKKEFDRLNIFEQYVFLFEAFWCAFDFGETLIFGFNPVEEAFKTFSRSTAGKELKKGAFTKRPDYDPLFSYSASIIHYFNYFGLCHFVPVADTDKKLTRYDDSIRTVTPTELGVKLGKILKEQEIVRWNIPALKEVGFYKGDVREDPGFVPLYKIIAPLFPAGKVKNIVSYNPGIIKGCYRFKVSLAGNIWRKIELSHQHSLLDFHNAIQDAFDFDDDHLYSFFMDGKKYSRNAYNSPLIDEGPHVDEISIGELELYEGQQVLYLFDYGDEWEFNVLLEKIDKNKPLPLKPIITDRKGKAPEQYRSF